MTKALAVAVVAVASLGACTAMDGGRTERSRFEAAGDNTYVMTVTERSWDLKGDDRSDVGWIEEHLREGNLCRGGFKIVNRAYRQDGRTVTIRCY